MFLVQSRLVQEEYLTTMVQNLSMESPAQVTIVTKHIHNNTDTPSKNIFDKEECGDVFYHERYDDQGKCGEIVDS